MQGDSMRPVTVIIPTYNRDKVLGRAIQSVLAQSHQEFELLIVDDGSEDDTQQVVQQFSDPRIVYLKHENNQGQCAAINTGIRAAKGDYVVFLDSDDEWLPTMIEKQVDIFQAHDSNLGLVYTLAGTRRADGSVELAFDCQLRGNVYKEVLTQGYLAPSITLMVRKPCFQKIGLFDTRFSCYQDDDICFRLAKEYRVDLVPEILAVMNDDADLRLTTNRLFCAQGWSDLIAKHEVEIRRECGDWVLAMHCLKAGELFMNASKPERARRAFARARDLAASRMVVIYDVIARGVPFAWPVVRKLQNLSARTQRFTELLKKPLANTFDGSDSKWIL